MGKKQRHVLLRLGDKGRKQRSTQKSFSKLEHFGLFLATKNQEEGREIKADTYDI